MRSSHERWDGDGYPDGLAGDDIPLPARIGFVCDAFNAILSGRPYGAARTRQEAIEELRAHAGTQFDPCLVELFCETLTPADQAAIPREVDARPRQRAATGTRG